MQLSIDSVGIHLTSYPFPTLIRLPVLLEDEGLIER
jgi:hypothetical protein